MASVCHMCALCNITLKLEYRVHCQKKKKPKKSEQTNKKNKFCDHFGQLFWLTFSCSHILCGTRFCMSKFMLNDICYMCPIKCVLFVHYVRYFGFYFRCSIAVTVTMHNNLFVPVIFQVFVIQLATYLPCVLFFSFLHFLLWFVFLFPLCSIDNLSFGVLFFMLPLALTSINTVILSHSKAKEWRHTTTKNVRTNLWQPSKQMLSPDSLCTQSFN